MFLSLRAYAADGEIRLERILVHRQQLIRAAMPGGIPVRDVVAESAEHVYTVPFLPIAVTNTT